MTVMAFAQERMPLEQDGSIAAAPNQIPMFEYNLVPAAASSDVLPYFPQDNPEPASAAAPATTPAQALAAAPISDSAYASDSGYNVRTASASGSTYSAATGSTPSPTAIGTPHSELVKSGAEWVGASENHADDEVDLSGDDDRLHARAPSPLELSTPASGLSPLSGLSHLSHLHLSHLSQFSSSPHFSHLSHLSHHSQRSEMQQSHATAYPESSEDKLPALESVHDLVERVEAWRESLRPQEPTQLKRNKAYVGLWALGVQDLLANPVLVTAVSSPAVSHLEFSVRR